MRKVTPLTAIFLVSIISGCDLYRAQHLMSPCPGGGGGNIVCIDPNTLAATPDPVEIRSGQFVHFFVNGDRGQLTIFFEPGTPVDQEGHQGAHAWAHAKKVNVKERHTYTIHIDGRKMDPTIIIDP